jgi:3',5'-cyclic AMP phosphodiesterase CpdA
MFKQIVLIALLVFFYSCNRIEKIQKPDVQIAFMADVHLGDIYGVFQDNDYKGILNPETGKYNLVRTMQSQLQSTRLFNENYFAFLAALDDVVRRGVKYLVLPGDFSDDGQLVNIKGLKRILNEYTKAFDIKFIATTGNHDPVKPFYQEAGKKDFLGKSGKSQTIFSKKDMVVSKDTNDLPVIITKDMAKLGYKDILNELKDFGFYPKKTDVFWETPFSDYFYENYSFEKALKASELNIRTYKIPTSNNEIPDVSYLVEPADNLWFLAIDANVYVPKDNIALKADNPAGYNSASIGYNNVLTHKKHLIEWIKSVSKRAEELGKSLIVFSHYPTIDFNDDATPEIKELFGEQNMQLHRVPKEEVAKALANAGVKVHFGGHMHINDTGVRHFEDGTSLINIQIPSMAAYIPGYKLLTIRDNNIYEIETIVIDSVPDFKTLFPLYKQEHEYLVSQNKADIWNLEVLDAKTYKDFTEWHLKELVRLRFLKEDWSEPFKTFLLESTGKDLLFSSFKDDLELLAFKEQLLKQNRVTEVFNNFTGLDMIKDFYKIKSADKLAFPDIGKNRLEAYKILCNQLKKSNLPDLKLWAKIFLKMMQGEPANHFEIDLKTNTIKRIDPLH